MTPTRWDYNCTDCIRTAQVGLEEERLAYAMGLLDPYRFQQKMFDPVLFAMIRGIRVDTARRAALAREIRAKREEIEEFFLHILGHRLNPSSSPQMRALFYTDLGLPPTRKRGKGGKPGPITCDDAALGRIATRRPVLRHLINAIADWRTLGTFASTFLNAPLSYDGRMRSSFNLCGAYTFRLSSSKDAFGSGANLENIPSDKSKSAGKAAKRGSLTFTLPNIRDLYVPDPGYIMFDGDLDRADLQVVVAESGEPEWREMMRLGVDMHLVNAFVLAGREPPPMEELVETHPEYPEHRARHKHQREFAKIFAHGCVVGDHEALTLRGWVPVDEIQDSDEILVAQADGRGAKFEVPESWWRGPCTSYLIHFEGEAIDQFVTWDHTLAYRTSAHLTFRSAKASVLPASARLVKSVLKEGTVSLPAPELLAAFHADGSLDAYGNITWNLKKERKIARLHALLEGVEYSASEGRFYLPRRAAQILGLTNKTLGWDALLWTHETATRYLEEQVHWDGHQGKTAQWMSGVDAQRAEIAHTLAHLHGYGSQRNLILREGRQPLHRWSLNCRGEWRLSSTTRTLHEGKGRLVYCPKTSTGFWLTRRNGKISLTGNTNYGGSAHTMAQHVGVTVREAERAQARWFGAHPGVRRWHEAVKAEIRSTRAITNRFGYRWQIADRPDAAFTAALAWVPQSTVALYINRVWRALWNQVPEVEILIQVHDSLVGQWPQSAQGVEARVAETARSVTIPYDPPLIIPFGLKTSPTSWGDCK